LGFRGTIFHKSFILWEILPGYCIRYYAFNAKDTKISTRQRSRLVASHKRKGFEKGNTLITHERSLLHAGSIEADDRRGRKNDERKFSVKKKKINIDKNIPWCANRNLRRVLRAQLTNTTAKESCRKSPNVSSWGEGAKNTVIFFDCTIHVVTIEPNHTDLKWCCESPRTHITTASI